MQILKLKIKRIFPLDILNLTRRHQKKTSVNVEADQPKLSKLRCRKHKVSGKNKQRFHHMKHHFQLSNIHAMGIQQERKKREKKLNRKIHEYNFFKISMQRYKKPNKPEVKSPQR